MKAVTCLFARLFPIFRGIWKYDSEYKEWMDLQFKKFSSKRETHLDSYLLSV